MMDIPRALSVDSRDYDWNVGARLNIRLDGVVQDRVVAYDIDAGTIIRYAVDEQGRGIGIGGAWVREKVSGLVEVTVIDLGSTAR